MSKGIMKVLGHQIEYDAGNIVIDADAEETLSNAIADTIEIQEKLSGTETLYLELEDTSEGALEEVLVTWTVVINPWKEVADEFRDVMQSIRSCIYDWGKHEDIINWSLELEKKYEQLIKEKNADKK